MSQDDRNQVVSDKQELFAVFRNGFRVSDETYPAPQYAQAELDYWRRIVERWPDGSQVTVRPLRRHTSEKKTTQEETA